MKAPVLNVRVLMVDGDDRFVDTLRPALEKSFMTVDRAACSAEAVGLLEKNLYDVILLDVLLDGGVGGLALSREVKGREGWREIPVLIVTAVDVRYGMNVKSYVGEEGCLPADGFIDKLAGCDEIVERTRSVVEKPDGRASVRGET